MSTSLTNRQRIMAAMYNIYAGIKLNPKAISFPQESRTSGGSWYLPRKSLSEERQREKIEACAIKQARKARRRLFCYKYGLLLNPIQNQDTKQRINSLFGNAE